jgi:transposase
MKRMKVEVLGVERRRRWRDDEKLRIVGETLEAGARITDVARRNGVAASLVFTWRRQSLEGRLGGLSAPAFVPVEITRDDRGEDCSANRLAEVGEDRKRRGPAISGLIEIDLGRRGRVRVDAEVDADALRRVLDVLAAR